MALTSIKVQGATPLHLYFTLPLITGPPIKQFGASLQPDPTMALLHGRYFASAWTLGLSLTL
jgi:hypothetical protein